MEQKRSPRFIQTTSNTRKGIPEILSNYFKNKTRNPRDSLKPLQKQNTRSPKDFFKSTSNSKQKDFLRILQITSKIKQKVSPRFFKTTSKTKQQRDFQSSFKLLQKPDTIGAP